MRVVVLFETMGGTTRTAAELIGGAIASNGAHEVSVRPVGEPDPHELSQADLIIVGSWTDGLVLFGQRPAKSAKFSQLPVLDGKRVAVFCTYAINAGNAAAKLADLMTERGAEIITAGLVHRKHLERDTADFANRAMAAVGADSLI